MAVSAELQIVISAINNAKSVLTSLSSDIGKVAASLKSVDEAPSGGKAVNELKNIGTSAKDAAGKLKDLNSETDKLKTGMNGLGSSIRLAIEGFIAFKSISLIKDFADTAARAQTLGIALHKIAENSGITSLEIDKIDSKVQKLGITAAASRQSLVQFIQANLDTSKAAALARAAQDLGIPSGLNSSETFNKLIVNIQQLDVQGLRTLGIVTTLEEANDKYALSLDLNANSLNKSQAQQALLNDVLEKSTALQGLYEASLTSVGKKLSSLDRVIEAFKVSFGDSLLPLYAVAVDVFTELIKELTAQANEFNASEESVSSFADSFRTFLTVIKDAIVFIAAHREAITNLALAYAAFRIGSFLQIFALVGGLSKLNGLMQAGYTFVVALGGAFPALAAAAATPLGALAALRVALIALFTSNPVGVLIVLGAALVTFVASSDRAKAALVVFGAAIELTIRTIMLPFRIGLIGVTASLAGLKAVLNGGSFTDAFNKSIKNSTDALKGDFVQAANVAKLAAQDALNGPASNAPIKKSISELTAEYKKIDETLTKLRATKASLIALDKDTTEIDKQLTLNLARQEGIKTTVFAQAAAKNATQATKDGAKALDEYAIAGKKAARVQKELNEAYDKQKTDLGILEFKYTKFGIVSAKLVGLGDSLSGSFKRLSADLESTNPDKARIAFQELKVAFETLASSAKTKSDLAYIKQLLDDIGLSGSKAAELTKIALGEKPAEVAIVKPTKSKGEDPRKKAREIAKAQSDLILAEQDKTLELSRQQISASIDVVAGLYENGKVSIKEFFEDTANAIQADSDVQVTGINARKDALAKEIAVAIKQKLPQTEILALRIQRISIEKELNLLLDETKNKLNKNLGDEKKAIEENTRLAEDSLQNLLEAQGKALEGEGKVAEAGKKTSEARRIALKQEREAALKEAGVGEDETSKNTRANIEETIKLKDLEITKDEKRAVLAAAELEFNTRLARLRADQLDLDIQIKAGILSEIQGRERLVELNKEAAKDLDVIVPKIEAAAEAINDETVEKVRQYGQALKALKVVVDATAVRINGVFKEASKTLFSDFIKGTKTASEAFQSFVTTVLDGIASILAEKITEGLYAQVFGATKDGESGGIGGFLSQLLEPKKDSKNDSKRDSRGASKGTPKGTSPTDAIYVRDATKPTGAVDLPKDKPIIDGTTPEESPTSVVDSFFETIKKGFDGLVDIGASVFGTIGEAFGGLVDIGASVFDTIGGFISNLFSSTGGGSSSGGGSFDYGAIFSSVLSFAGFADGGLISGAGTGTSDSIPIRASHGEFITKASATSRWLPLLQAINSGTLDSMTVRSPTRPYFAEGGLVDSGALEGSMNGGRSNGNSNMRNIVVNQNISTPDANSFRKSQNQIASDTGRLINRAVKRNS